MRTVYHRPQQDAASVCSLACRTPSSPFFPARHKAKKDDGPQARGRGLDPDPTPAPMDGPILVTQLMQDMYDVDQAGFVIPAVTESKTMVATFAAKTSNAVPADYASVATSAIACNGVTRILVTPMTAGGKTGADDTSAVYGRTVTFGAFAVTTSAFYVNETKQEVSGALPPNGAYAPFLWDQKLSYAVTVYTGDELAAELGRVFGDTAGADATATMPVASLYGAVVGASGVAAPERSFLEQGVANINAQYGGTYAASSIKSRVERLHEALLVGETPAKIVELKFQDNHTKFTATSVASATPFAVGDATTIAAGSGGVPVLAMIQIDFPEDLVQNVYSSPADASGKINLSVINVAFQVSTCIGVKAVA